MNTNEHELFRHVEYVISLAGRFPEHREDVSKAFDAIDLLVKRLIELERQVP